MGFPNVAFRLDAGPLEGLGHLQRCAVLAAELQSNNCGVQFVCRSREARTAGRFQGLRVFYLNEITAAGPSDGSEEWDARATLLAIGSTAKAGWFVVDHYGLSRIWEQEVRAAGYKVAAIDDYRSRRHHANLLISDSSLSFDGALNSESDAMALTGPSYSLLGAEYSADKAHAVTAVNRILVTYGAADPTGETLKAIEALGELVSQGELATNVRIDVVVGPLNASPYALFVAAEARGQVVHHAPTSLVALMRLADLVVTAGGSTMVEALAILRPCVATITAPNQALLASDLSRRGLLTVAGDARSVSVNKLREVIAGAVQAAAVQADHLAAVRPFDLQGAQRISAALLALDSRSETDRQTRAAQ